MIPDATTRHRVRFRSQGGTEVTTPERRSDEAAQTIECEHHWVSQHRPDFPDAIYWVAVCSLCGGANGNSLAEEISPLLADLAAARVENERLTGDRNTMMRRVDEARDETWTQRQRADRAEAKIAEALTWCDQYESPVDGDAPDSPIDRLMFEERCRTAAHVAMQIRAALAATTAGEPEPATCDHGRTGPHPVDELCCCDAELERHTHVVQCPGPEEKR